MRLPVANCSWTGGKKYALVRVLRPVLHAFCSALHGVLGPVRSVLSVALCRVVSLLRPVLDGAAGVFSRVFGFLAGTLRILLGCVVFAGIRLLAECHHWRSCQRGSE